MSIVKKLRSFYWITKEFLKRHYKKIVSATLIGIALVLLASTFIRYLPTPKSTTRVGRVGKYTLSTLPKDLKNKISLGLVKIDKSGDVLPALATNWQISDDGKVYTITIDTKRKWHDNSPLIPRDLVYSFKEVEQEYTDSQIIFKLKEPFSPLLSVLSKPIFKSDKIGIGEYQIDQVKQTGGVLQQLTLSTINHRITYKFYPTESLAITAFKLGEIDIIEEISFIPDDIRQETNLTIKPSTLQNRTAVMFLNNNDALLSGKSIRQALSYAIKDKSFGKDRAISPIPNSSWAHNSNVKPYEYDPQKAKRLFDQDVKDPANVSLEIKTTLQYLEIAETIANDWEEVLGISVNVKVTTNLSDQYQVLLVDYAPPIDPDQYTTWHSTQSTNFTHYQSLKVDKLLEDGRRTNDRELRKKIYSDFQRFLLEDSPAIFLFSTSNYVITRKPLLRS